ncbi:hypothetical protein [Spirosoma sp.]
MYINTHAVHERVCPAEESGEYVENKLAGNAKRRIGLSGVYLVNI